MKPIPILFKRGGGGGKLTDTPTNALAKAILEGASGWTPRRELSARASFLLDDEKRWWQYRVLRGADKRPERFVETWHSKPRKAHLSPESVRGWVPAEQGSAYAFLKAALRSVGNDALVPGSTYALVDGNEGPCLIRHADAEVCEPLLGEKLNLKMLKAFFLESLDNIGWKGVVWYSENGETLKLSVSDFQ